MLIALAVGFLTRWEKVADDPKAGLVAGVGLTLIVFVTYCVLGLAGFKASPLGAVNVPRVYVWSLLCAIAALVFGVLFYFLGHS